MKPLKLFLVAAVVTVSSLFTISCGGSEKEANPLADSLELVNGSLNGELSAKEVALQEFVSSFNEIQENLKPRRPCTRPASGHLPGRFAAPSRQPGAVHAATDLDTGA